MPVNGNYLFEDLESVYHLKNNIAAGHKIVFITGAFNVLHSGHLRLLNFGSECGDILVVGVYKDGTSGCVLPQKDRLEAIQSVSVVNYAFVMDDSLEDILGSLKPDIVVKGKEHEESINPEQELIEKYGGKLLFSSGHVRFSSADLLQTEVNKINLSTLDKPLEFCNRHNFSMNDLERILMNISGLNVIVIGDLIVDEYVSCEPLGMSQEDPTIVVTPIASERFTGGAAIVAAHARSLGANTNFFSVVGDDENADYAAEQLSEYGVKHLLVRDSTRPTTLKKRYRARDKTLLRVNELRQHDLSKDLVEQLTKSIIPELADADLLIFSDFNYGCLPQNFVDEICMHANKSGVMMVADSQASSQYSDISRFKEMLMVTPTEREARLAVRDFSTGLVDLATKLQEVSGAKNVLMTLGAEGVFIQEYIKSGAYGVITDRLPAMNIAPRDVAGGGDSMLVTTAMALAVEASIWEASYLGSLAAASQVGRIGNLPLKIDELLADIRS